MVCNKRCIFKTVTYIEVISVISLSRSFRNSINHRLFNLIFENTYPIAQRNITV